MKKKQFFTISLHPNFYNHYVAIREESYGVRSRSWGSTLESGLKKVLPNPGNNIEELIANNVTYVFATDSVEYYTDIDNIDKITISSRDLVAGDQVYFHPDVSLPRFKFKDAGDKVGFKVKRSYESANVLVLDATALKKSANRLNWRERSAKTFHYGELKAQLQEHGVDIDPLFSQEQLDYINDLTEDERYVIHLGSGVDDLLSECQLSNYNSKTSFDLYTWLSLSKCVEYDRSNNRSYFALIYHFIENNKEIIETSAVMAQVTPKTALTEKMYARLSQMLSSGVDADVSLAMETITNLDIESDFYKLMKLLNQHKDTIRWHTSYRQVNFKGFRTTLDAYVSTAKDSSIRNYVDYFFEQNLDWHQYLEILGQTGNLKEEHLVDILPMYKAMLKSNVIYFDRYFQIKSIQLSDYTKELLERGKEKELDKIEENAIQESEAGI